MISKPGSCFGCPLVGTGVGYSGPDGTGMSGIFLLGEALGRTEAWTGIPFTGDAGAQLNRTLQYSTLDRRDFTIDNVVRCRPPNNWLVGAPWEASSTAHCRPNWVSALKASKARIIVPMGNVPMRSVLGLWGIERKRGYLYEAYVDTVRYPVIPTVHPSFVMQGNQPWTWVQIQDLKKAVAHVNAMPAPYLASYVENPSVADVAAFLAGAAASAPGRWLAVDIETSSSGTIDEEEYDEIVETEIHRVSFSYEPGTAITIPWRNKFIPGIQAIMSLPFERHVYWKASFDVPRLKGAGILMDDRKILDAMEMWHYLHSDLPKNLAFVTPFFSRMPEWKSKSDAFPEYYSCCDADAEITCAYGIRDELRKLGKLDVFMRHQVELDPILKQMSRNGILIDRNAQSAFREKMQSELARVDGEIQSHVPQAVRKSKVYKRVPAEVMPGDPHPNGTWSVTPDGEFCVVEPFKANSSQQVIKYIKSQKHPVPRNRKEDRDTTDKDELASLARRYPKDPLYGRIVESREYAKMIGQYCDGYEPDPDGRLRSTFTQHTSTLRLASKRPNVQNVRKRWHLASEYRKQFTAGPGNVLVEFDYRAIEALLVGWYANDPDYIRAARLGVHAILASHVLGDPVDLGWDDSRILSVVRDIKKAEPETYDMSKMICHMSNYLGSPNRIKQEHSAIFDSVRKAQELQELYFGTIGRRIRPWQRSVLAEADRQCYLDNAFGYRHWFWDVFHYDGRRKRTVLGTDAKKALAFRPQSTAACICKDAMLRVWKMAYYRTRLNLQVHDSLMFELPDDRNLSGRIRSIRSMMEQAVPELGGLTVEVEVSVGRNWGQMREVS